MPDDNISRSLSNLYSLLLKQNHPDSKTEEIKDPLMNMHIEIKDPTLCKEEMNEPKKENSNLTLPCLIKEEMTEPSRNMPMLATDCSDKKDKKEKKEDNSCKKSKDSCQQNRPRKDDCSNEKKKKRTDVFQSLPKAKFDDFNFNQKCSMPCQRVRAGDSKVTCFSDPNETCGVTSKKGSICSEKVSENVDIYKKKDICDKRNIGYPNQAGPVEIAEPCPTKTQDPCISTTQPPCPVPRECPLVCDDKEKHQQATTGFKQMEVQRKPHVQEPREDKPMGPGEITCPQRESFTARKCCEEIELCEKSSIKYAEPKCEIQQPMERQGVHLKDTQVCRVDKCQIQEEEIKKPRGMYVEEIFY